MPALCVPMTFCPSASEHLSPGIASWAQRGETGKPNGLFLLAPCCVASPRFKHLKTSTYFDKICPSSSEGLIKDVMPLDDASSTPALQLSFKSAMCQPIEWEWLSLRPYNTNQDERILTIRARRDVRNPCIRFCIVKMSKWLFHRQWLAQGHTVN